VLLGNGGSDYVDGGLGIDFADGGAGVDTVKLSRTEIFTNFEIFA